MKQPDLWKILENLTALYKTVYDQERRIAYLERVIVKAVEVKPD